MSARKYSTSTGGRNYVLHINVGGRTLCNRDASSVNCAGDEDVRKLTEEDACRVCLRKHKANTTKTAARAVRGGS